MTLRMATLNGKPPRNFKRTPRDKDLKEAASVVSSARRVFQRPNFIPTDPQELQDLGSQLLEWSQDTESISIDDFFLKFKLAPSRFYRACQTNEFLNACYEYALCAINKRITEALRNNQLYLMNTVKHYDSQYIEEARMKREAEKDTQVTKIFVEEKIGIPVFTNKKDK